MCQRFSASKTSVGRKMHKEHTTIPRSTCLPAPHEKWLSRNWMLTLGIGCRTNTLDRGNWYHHLPHKATKPRRQMCLIGLPIPSAPSQGSKSNSLKKPFYQFNWKTSVKTKKVTGRLQPSEHADSQMSLSNRWKHKKAGKILGNINNCRGSVFTFNHFVIKIETVAK